MQKERESRLSQSSKLQKQTNSKSLKIKSRQSASGTESSKSSSKSKSRKNKITLQSVTKKNIELEKQLRQKIKQARLIKLNIGLRMMATTLEDKIYRVKASVFNSIKDNMNEETKRQSQLRRAFELMKSGEHSEIHENSDNESLNQDQDVANILESISSEHKSTKNKDKILHNNMIQEELGESSSSNKDYPHHKRDTKEIFSLNLKLDHDHPSSKPKIEFNPKMPLSIDIPAGESDNEENMIIYDSKSNRIDKNSDDQDESEGEGEENMSKYNPWINASEKNESPFSDYKKRLIINTDSMDSGHIKVLKTNGGKPNLRYFNIIKWTTFSSLHILWF